MPFLRDYMLIDDIPGVRREDKHEHIKTRNHIRSDDVPGAQVKNYHKFYPDKETYMGQKDLPKKTIRELRSVKSNPLSPKYKTGKNLDGDDVTIGEISGQRPKTYYKRARFSERDNMYCSMKTIEWQPNSDKFQPKLPNGIRATAGGSSAVCANVHLIQENDTWGKKKFKEHQHKNTLDGILETPKRRIHVAAKPPVYRQPRKKLATKKRTQIFFTNDN